MISRVRGTQDILPARFTDKTDAQIECWELVERTAREAFRRYGFDEIRTPVIERTELFERGVGTETDVNKEMYTFDDRDGERVSLRPEQTASVVRAYIEHGLFNQPGLVKLFYIGAQFRRERPQKGRYRQFGQVGVEVQMLGGPAAKGFGFAFGIERMIMSLPADRASSLRMTPAVFLAYIGETAREHSLALTRRLRQAGVSAVIDLEGRKLKKSLAIANSIAARYALIIGDDEIQNAAYVLRDMSTGEQKNLGEDELIVTLKQ